jgi:hypothetical protein
MIPVTVGRLGLLALVGCRSANSQLGGAPPPPTTARHMWEAGARDSATALQLACELIQSLSSAPGSECQLEQFRNAPTEYIVRVREVAPPNVQAPDFPLSDVRLTKDGAHAVVERIPDL